MPGPGSHTGTLCPMRLGIVCLGLALASPAFAQTVVEAGRGIVRTVNVGTAPYGLDVDPATGTVFFIGDAGRDLYRLDTDDTVTQIANNVGIFVGQLSDLVLGADGLLYAMTTMGAEAGTIQRFMTDGTELSPLATIATTPMSNAAGLDFDCFGNLYASDQEVFIFRVTPAGGVSSYSVGWQDVDEITRGYDDILYVQDGTARPFGHDKVFRVAPDGTISIFASGLPGEIESGAFDFATGDYFAGDYDLGAIYRLHDADGDGVSDVRTDVATGFGVNALVDIDYGRSSLVPTEYSLYVSIFSSNQIVEIGGFPPPPSPFDCGSHIDDDSDGWCEDGEDRNGDGDCHDPLEVVPGGPVDCDDGSASINPSIVESTRLLCSDFSDSDCDGDVDLDDDDCDAFDDDDGDGYCEAGIDGNGDGDCLDALEDVGPFDCDDTRGGVSPGLDESGLARCTNGFDDDCDGDTDLADTGCAPYDDADGDGFCETGRDLDGDGDCETAAELMGPVDCDDGAAAAFPGNIEACGDGIDNDCDGDVDVADLDCVDRRDDDGDGFCELGIDLNGDMDCVDAGEATADSDCNDAAPLINPAATEDCGDGVDNDCNGLIDAEEAVCAAVTDADGDGFCESGTDGNGDGDCLDAGEDTLETDCDDAEPTIHPGAPENTVELCRDADDNDCDLAIDLLDGDCGSFIDADGDGWCPAGEDLGGDGNCIGVGETDGAGPFDCDDAMMSVSPDATELCTNGIDDDCNGLIDIEDATCGGFLDADGDGWCPLGIDENSDGDCNDAGEPDGAGPFDCNDLATAVNPDADEICNDAIDNDCDGSSDLADDDCRALSDGDGDGVCPNGRDLNGDRDCLDPGENTGESDCDDDNSLVAPGLEEICGDGIDNDCDGLIDVEDGGCSAAVDADGDGWCPAGRDDDGDGDCLDAGEDVMSGDCNDGNAAVNPDADEICDDTLDNDCNGFADGEDELCDPSLFDTDDDGWCPGGRDLNDDGDCRDEGEDVTPADCDDTDASVSPDALEECTDDECAACSDMRDNDCDALMDAADPGCGGTTVDMDGDGICAMAGRDRNGDGDCDDPDESTGEIDCNDSDANVFPGAEDICGDAIDQDCDGLDLDCGEPDDGFTGGACSGCTVPSSRSEGSPWWVLLVLVPWIRRRLRS